MAICSLYHVLYYDKYYALCIILFYIILHIYFIYGLIKLKRFFMYYFVDFNVHKDSAKTGHASWWCFTQISYCYKHLHQFMICKN